MMKHSLSKFIFMLYRNKKIMSCYTEPNTGLRKVSFHIVGIDQSHETRSVAQLYETVQINHEDSARCSVII